MSEPTDLASFQHNLGRELVGAAYRQHNQATVPNRVRRPRPAPAILLALVVLAAGTLVAIVGLQPQPAAAGAIEITRLENAVQLDVVDIITDPRQVETQLADELGLKAELIAIPAAPELEGQISVAATSGQTAPETVFENDRITRITLPDGFNGDLLIEYGRQAEPGEPYIATTTDQSCAEHWGATPAQSQAPLAELAPSIRYETLDQNNQITIDVPPEQIDPDYHLVDITYLSATEIVVIYAANLDAIPRHPNCQ